jgi:hypothetical protein
MSNKIFKQKFGIFKHALHNYAVGEIRLPPLSSSVYCSPPCHKHQPTIPDKSFQMTLTKKIKEQLLPKIPKNAMNNIFKLFNNFN